MCAFGLYWLLGSDLAKLLTDLSSFIVMVKDLG